MVVKFLLGPAGSGKTFRCLAEIQAALSADPEGPPLLLLAPKQSTYQLERALVAREQPSGYTRLRVLSFSRLADFIFECLNAPRPGLLSAEGRLMVLRSIIARHRKELKLFRASTRLTGFADQLALSLDEFQQQQLTPQKLRDAADRINNRGLASKLEDLATLLERYLEWQNSRQLVDDAGILAAACSLLKAEAHPAPFLAHGLWVDGFADLSSQEAALIAATASCCEKTTITFCLERAPGQCEGPILSSWSTIERSYRRCEKHLAGLSPTTPGVQVLNRQSPGRFEPGHAFNFLSEHWNDGISFPAHPKSACRLVVCSNPEVEVREAAREIIRHVREGGRFRDAAVLVRSLSSYHDLFRRIFISFEIPCFIDRRESISHHPLAELTRSGIRTVVLNWLPEDWFAALKSGLMGVPEEKIDFLENEALARGWRGDKWRKPAVSDEDPAAADLRSLLNQIMPPFERLRIALLGPQHGLSGREVSAAIRHFWGDLGIQSKIEAWAKADKSGPVSGEAHLTALGQLSAWLEDLELGFPEEKLRAREWIPVLEAGLNRLTVGLIPPALDQVLIGSIDRSRSVEAQLVLVLGLNEGVFPAQSEQSVLLTESDRALLERLEIAIGDTRRRQAAKERHLAYLAFTRATRRMVVSCCSQDADGGPLNPSPFFFQLQSMFPELPTELINQAEWRQAEHPHELVLPVLRSLRGVTADCGNSFLQANANTRTARLVRTVLGVIEPLATSHEEVQIAPEIARQLYGPVLKTSVSRLEQFAACPFRFFVHSGLAAKERVRFELDARERGNFQHEVLAEFHNRLAKQGKKWRDLTPPEARQLVGKIARELAGSYREGLLIQDESTGFQSELVTEALQDFVETMVDWMRSQYAFDPIAAELPFGSDGECPPWELELANGFKLQLHGRIDRIDLHRDGSGGRAACVIIDYKSNAKKLDPVFVENGIQLQLLSYLNVVRCVPRVKEIFRVAHLDLAGVFYVSLRGNYPGEKNRNLALTDTLGERKQAYRHTGRFNFEHLRLLDGRENQPTGDQFAYRLKNNGEPYANCVEAMSTTRFEELLRRVEANLRTMGDQIFSGEAAVSPYRKSAVAACQTCDYCSICRTDPWTQHYRSLAGPGQKDT